jgi:hypothetical protein
MGVERHIILVIWLKDNIKMNLECGVKIFIELVVVPLLPRNEHHATKAHWGSGGTAPPIL